MIARRSLLGMAAGVAALLWAPAAPAQVTRIVVAYSGPLGGEYGPTDPIPGIAGPGWVPITRSGLDGISWLLPLTNRQGNHYEVYTNAQNFWLTDTNGIGSRYVLDHTGAPDYIVVRPGPVRQIDGVALRPARVTKFKNGVRMTAGLEQLLPHVQRANTPPPTAHLENDPPPGN